MASTRQQVVKIAQGYVGCRQGDKKHRDLVDTFNDVSPHGEVGNYKCAWCAITWTAIQIKAGNPQTVAPYSYNCGTLITYAKKINAWVENDAFVPSPGDGIIYYWGDTGKGDCGVDNGVGCASHVGIVESVSGGYITVIEGNKGTTAACGRRRIQVNSRYIRGFITPHYADGTSEYDYTVDVDGDWGYCTTLTTQHVLGCTEDGEMGTNSWKAVQKKVGATVDGEPGPNTYTKMAEFLGMGTKSTTYNRLTSDLVKAWQTWLNSQVKPTPTPSKKKYDGEIPNVNVSINTSVIEDAIAWGMKIANDNTYIYKKWSSKDANTKKCSWCNPELLKIPKYKGANCIGFGGAMLHHGGGASVPCKCNGLVGGNETYSKCTLAYWKKRNGANWIELSKSQRGCTIVCFDKNGKYKHIATSLGGGYVLDATSSKGIAKRKTALSQYKKKYFLYTGTKTSSRNWLQEGDTGSEVLKMQKALQWCGYDLGSAGADSEFGPSTKQAVLNYQKDYGLVQDGEWGEACNAKLKEIEK